MVTRPRIRWLQVRLLYNRIHHNRIHCPPVIHQDPKPLPLGHHACRQPSAARIGHQQLPVAQRRATLRRLVQNRPPLPVLFRYEFPTLTQLNTQFTFALAGPVRDREAVLQTFFAVHKPFRNSLAAIFQPVHIFMDPHGATGNNLLAQPPPALQLQPPTPRLAVRLYGKPLAIKPRQPAVIMRPRLIPTLPIRKHAVPVALILRPDLFPINQIEAGGQFRLAVRGWRGVTQNRAERPTFGKRTEICCWQDRRNCRNYEENNTAIREKRHSELQGQVMLKWKQYRTIRTGLCHTIYYVPLP